MKKIFGLLILFSVVMTNLNAQIDRSVRPEPLPEKEFQFPNHTTHKLRNGLRVFVIEDKEQPTIALRLLIPGGTSMDGNLPGTAELTAGLLTKGAGKMTALDIAKTIDGIGASISARASGDAVIVSASGLKKHTNTILDVFKNVVLKPTFPKQELEKLTEQMIANLQYEKSQPEQVGQTLARKVIYGDEHPYALKANENSIQKISIKEVQNYYNTYFIPNNATLAVIGDVSAKDIIPELEKAFADWKQGSIPKINIPEPKPEPLGVYFIQRPASEQTTLIVTNLAVPYKHNDYITLDLASKIIGSGFGGRLFRTLREKYSFTYTPWGYLTTSKYINRFACGADVNSEKTDSSLNVIFEQIGSLAEDGPTDDELNRMKRFVIGQYKLSFENSDFVASLIQEADFMGVSLEQYKNYTKILEEITPNNIRHVAYQYLNPQKSRIIAVGDPSIRPMLEKFGTVFDYNIDLEPLSGPKAKLDEVSLSPKDLIERHRRALGGDAINNVQSIKKIAKSRINLGGQLINGEITQFIKSPNKMYMKLDMQIMQQEIWIDGNEGYVNAFGETSKLEGMMLEQLIFEATPFATCKLLDMGYKVEIKGKKNGEIIALVTSPSNIQSTFYFDENTYLVNKYETVEQGPQGPTPLTVKFSNWSSLNGVKLPARVENISSIITMINDYNYELNVPFDDELFKPHN
ncbi:MAG TPA: pitrilysin family protein [Candidatus Kapabacteria bacterium]|nr:pitrilysin family protein [Candidatus Kapabacteria bacterium]